jgi:hypothetical protein
MTIAAVPPAAVPPGAGPAARPHRTPVPAAGRLLRIELRRNAMLWMLPVAVALFWYQAYRHVMALPAMWNIRAMSLQNDALLDFAMPVTGAAAWMGWREARRHVTEMLTSTARARWARHLATWAGTTCWAMAAYLACVAVVYVITARQASWGGPLWWPAVVGAVGIPALSALGFTAGVLFPSRFTVPLVTLVAFFGLGFGTTAAHGDHSYLQISPLVAGSYDVGADPGVATFYRYLPDLSIAQVMFLAGITIALLGIVGLPAGSGGRRLRMAAGVITAAGLAAAGTAVALAGTGRLDQHGMTVIPALHDAASDQPVKYTPVCSRTVIPLCVNPAYAAFLPNVTSALEHILSQIARLPGAPAKLNQAPQSYQQVQGNGIILGGSTDTSSGFILPAVPGTQGMTTASFATELEASTAFPIVARVVGADPQGPATSAQQAVLSALTGIGPASRSLGIPPGMLPQPGSPADLAARRFAALPAAARHAWLVQHIAALRAGHVSLAQLP